jgi:basic amino acid/polyamine antiporter, APA family
MAENTKQPASADAALVRAIGVRALSASIVNTTVGAGIFVLPAAVAAQIGPAAPVAYLVCAMAMAMIVASFAIAGSRVSLTGGLYAYVEVAFGPFVGYLAGVLLWSASVLSAASVASALADSMSLLLPVVGSTAGRTMFLALVFGAFAAVNVRGVRWGAGVVEAVTLAKLLPLFAFVALGLVWLGSHPLPRPELPAASDLGQSALLLIFAFVGVEVALVPSGEVRDPSRTVPRALFLALGLTTALYLAIQLVAQAVLGADLARFSEAPLAEAFSRLTGPVGRTVVLLGAIVSMTGYVSGDMLGSPRTLFAFGRDGFLPATLARVHPRFRTPHVAILVHGPLVWLAASLGSFGRLALLSNVAILSLYFLCCAGAYELLRRDVRGDGTPFRMPGEKLVPILACLAILGLLSSATAAEWVVEAVVVAVAGVAYFLRPGRRNRDSSILDESRG